MRIPHPIRRPDTRSRTATNCSSARAAALEAVYKAGITVSQIGCLGFDNQGESTVAWDADTGMPLGPVITWQDKRTAADIEAMPAETRERIRSITGLVPDAYFSATKMRHILTVYPDAAEKAKTGKLRMGTLDSFILYRMTDGQSFFTDPSTASRTMLYDIRTGDWSEELLRLFGIPRECLADIRPTVGPFGITSPKFLGGAIPITGSAVDQQAALFGQCCFAPGELKATYGTGCFLLMNTGNTPVLSDNGLLTTVAWEMDGKRSFALDGGVCSAGSTVNWLKSNMNFISAPSETEKMALSVPDTAGVYFIPAFSGLSAPYWDQSARGTITGMTLMTRKEHVVRAALEGIAYQVVDIVRSMESDCRSPVSLIRADGGLTENAFLMQFQSDILDIPLEVPCIYETTAFGASVMAGLGAGRLSSAEDIRRIWKCAARYEPSMPRSKRESLLEGWHEAIQYSRKTKA